MIRTKPIAPVAAAVLLLGAVSQAEAVPILRLSTDGGDVAAVADGDLTDANATDGAVTFVGSLDGWSVNVTTGLSKPLIGSEYEPVLDLNSVNVNSVGLGTLTIELTDTDFLLDGPVWATAEIGGVAGSTLSYKTFYDAGNTAFGQGGALHDLGAFGTGAFSDTESTMLLAPALYSLTLLVSITHDAVGEASSFNAALRVPEPSSVALLGSGLLLLAGVGRRRRLAKKS